MPWDEVSKMDQRRRFIEDHQLDVMSFSELCRRYGIARPTGYTWLERFAAGGVAALADRSHAPHACPHATPAEIWEAVRQVRLRHPTWGGKKIRRILTNHGMTLASRPSTTDCGPSTAITAAWVLQRTARSHR